MEKLNEKMINAGLSSYARAGFETALWDAYSKIKNIPIFEILGAERKEIESGLAVGIYDKIDDLIRVVGNELDTGNYKRVKIKVQKGWDITPIKVIRESFGDIPLMVDANCAYTRDDIEHLRKFDEFELLMIEQPLKKDDLEGHAILQEKIHTPICLDESVDSIDKLKLAIELKSCKIINIKIQRVGGILISKKFHDICKGEGIPVWIGTMPELGIGSAYALNLCLLDNCKFPTDVESSKRWYIDDIITPLIDVKNGIINFTDDLSFEVNFDKIEKYTIKQKKINF
jgi:o-succinylbenzoate synthase